MGETEVGGSRENEGYGGGHQAALGEEGKGEARVTDSKVNMTLYNYSISNIIIILAKMSLTLNPSTTPRSSVEIPTRRLAATRPRVRVT